MEGKDWQRMIDDDVEFGLGNSRTGLRSARKIFYFIFYCNYMYRTAICGEEGVTPPRRILLQFGCGEEGMGSNTKSSATPQSYSNSRTATNDDDDWGMGYCAHPPQM
jgi:hypothetical protein